jgi:hypothetical protein
MRLLYASGFPLQERKTYRQIIFTNILNSLRMILEAMVIYEYTFEMEKNKVIHPIRDSTAFPSMHWTLHP